MENQNQDWVDNEASAGEQEALRLLDVLMAANAGAPAEVLIVEACRGWADCRRLVDKAVEALKEQRDRIEAERAKARLLDEQVELLERRLAARNEELAERTLASIPDGL